MNRTVGICGYVKTGSSTITQLLREFDEIQVLNDIEFDLTYFPDGLEDLEYHLKNYHKYMSPVLAIHRFRKLVKKMNGYKRAAGEKFISAADVFLNRITQVSWNGNGNIDKLIRSSVAMFAKKCVFRIAKILRFYSFIKMYISIFPIKMDLCIMPENFLEAAKDFVSDILDAMNRDSVRITVLDQPFEGCNPVKSFKYFENPKAIVVDRDPRDHYLVVKKYLRRQGMGYQIPCENVDDYIKYFRLVHKSPPNLRKREDILFLNYEELIYNYESTVKKIADFIGVTKHSHKGKYFKPSYARNNTELFKRYKSYEADIRKIEQELPDYLFHFENYPNVEPDGIEYWWHDQ